MPVAIRAITRLQDADDINVSLGVGVDEYVLTYDHDTGKFVLRAMSAGVTDHGALTGLADDDHAQYLLATGARTGASSQAQTFTNGIIGPSWKPASDSTTALQVQQAGGTAIITVDTANKRVGINHTPGDSALTLKPKDINDYAMELYAYNDSLIGLVVNDPAYVGFFGQGNANFQFKSAATAGKGFVFGLGHSSGFISAEDTGGYQLMHVTEAEFVINQLSKPDFDFRVESDNDTHCLFVDGSTDRVGVSTNAPSTQLHINLNNATTAAVDSILTIAHNSTGTPAAYFGSGIAFNLQSSTNADQPAATLNTLWADATHATRSAAVTLNTTYNGGLVNVAKFGGTLGCVLNEDGLPWNDLRVESDNYNALYVRSSADSISIMDHASGKVGFYGTTPIVKQTGVAVTAAGIHAALVALGLIAA